MAKDALAFQNDLLTMLRVHFPGATKGNVEQNDRAAGELAMALGGLLAFAFQLNGPVIGRTVLNTIVTKIIENATAINKEAGELIRQDLKIEPPKH
jgi:hypothetical protein